MIKTKITLCFVFILGILSGSCSKLDNIFLFVGANPLIANQVDTTSLYAELQYPNGQERIG